MNLGYPVGTVNFAALFAAQMGEKRFHWAVIVAPTTELRSPISWSTRSGLVMSAARRFPPRYCWLL
jgi:hypothetical protein